MDERTVRRLLEQRLADDFHSHEALAEEIGVSRQLVSLVLQGERAPGGAILRFLGLRRRTRVSYEPLHPEDKPLRNGAASATVARQKREGRNHAKSPRAQQPVD